MATQLHTVLNRLDKVNDNLDQLNASQTETVQVSQLWQTSYLAASGDEQNDSSTSTTSPLSILRKNNNNNQHTER
jgi:hypothetical protein